MPVMEKSPDAFRTISEVAEVLDTPAHVLRFWESRFPQIRPVKRAGGRRYYRPADVALLAGIKRLLHDEGMTIRGVQKILREQGVRHVAGATDGSSVIDAYDILGLAEAAAQAGRDEPAAQVIDLSARSRMNGLALSVPAAEVHHETDVQVGEDFVAAASAVVLESDIEPTADADADGIAVPDEAHLPVAASAKVPAVVAPPPTDPIATPPDIATAQHHMQPSLGWMPTRLRCLSAGALDGHAAAIAPLAARLSDLRDRLAQAARPGRG